MSDKKSIYANYGLDLSKVEEGTWFELSAGEMKVKLRNANSKVYKKALVDARNSFKGMRKLTEAQFEIIGKKGLVYGLLLDWSGFYDEEGKEIPFSTEKAWEIFNDDRLIDLANEVIAFAQDSEQFRLENKEESEKN